MEVEDLPKVVQFPDPEPSTRRKKRPASKVSTSSGKNPAVETQLQYVEQLTKNLEDANLQKEMEIEQVQASKVQIAQEKARVAVNQTLRKSQEHMRMGERERKVEEEKFKKKAEKFFESTEDVTQLVALLNNYKSHFAETLAAQGFQFPRKPYEPSDGFVFLKQQKDLIESLLSSFNAPVVVMYILRQAGALIESFMVSFLDMDWISKNGGIVGAIDQVFKDPSAAFLVTQIAARWAVFTHQPPELQLLLRIIMQIRTQVKMGDKVSEKTKQRSSDL